jgi:hypothetical protein
VGRRVGLLAQDDLGEVVAEDDLRETVVVGRAIRPRDSLMDLLQQLNPVTQS